jgi:hypothetical protein
MTKGMSRDSAVKIFARIEGYVGENWGAIFVLAFMILLIIAAGSLAIGLDSFANEVAIFAYYALVAGVFLELACFLKHGRKSGNKDQ